MNDTLDRRHFLRLAALAGAGAALPWTVSPANAADSVAPDEALKSLMDGNARYVAGDMNLSGYTAERESMAAGQSPRAIILGCADSRVPPEIIFDQNRGQLFVVRVAGNFIEQDGLASMEYAVKVLGSRLIVVLGHSGCGAVEASIQYVKEDAQLPGHLPDLVRAIKPAVEEVKGKPGDMLTNAIEANARYNAAKLSKAAPIVSKAVADGHVKVVSGVYDLETGRVAISE